MRFSMISLGALLLAATATPAFAQDAAPNAPAPATDAPLPPKDFTVTGAVTLVSDYRFRGLTQTDGTAAVQGTLNLNSKAGFYVGVWASTIDGDGTTPLLAGYGDAEVDLYGGYTKTFGGTTVDAGVLYYYYPSAVRGLNTDFFEPYASVAYTIGPVTPKLGVKYAWGGQDGLNFTASNDDNIYGFGELAVGIPKLPVTVTAHVGYTDGSLGLANRIASDETYWDWSLTAEAVSGPFKAGVSYVDTDVDNTGHYATRLGRGAKVLGYLSVFF